MSEIAWFFKLCCKCSVIDNELCQDLDDACQFLVTTFESCYRVIKSFDFSSVNDSVVVACNLDVIERGWPHLDGGVGRYLRPWQNPWKSSD